MSMLEVKNLNVEYITSYETVKAVNGISFQIEEGECMGLVGETGAGKTTTAMSIIRLLIMPPANIPDGEVIFNGQSILDIEEKEMRKIRGNDITMVFQDPMSSLNPVKRVGDQIAEVIKQHRNCTKKEAFTLACEMLKSVGIEEERAIEYPHQFSGGMKQRVVIAMALACEPKLLLADEPTTALDVTIQAQVIKNISALRDKYKMAMLFITHDLGLVADICDNVAIMYAGEIVEYGNLQHIYLETGHPYTKGLFGSIPSLATDVNRLTPIEGLPPNPADLPKGCKFHTRCPESAGMCESINPEMIEVSEGHFVKCHLNTLEEVVGE